jgi:hypothetical protein
MSGNNINAPTVKGVQIEVTKKEVVVDASIFNYKIIIDLILIGLAVYLNIRVIDVSLYFIPLCAMYVGLACMVWMDFKPINKIMINLFENTITIQNKNPLSRIFILKKTYSGEDIESLKIRSNNSSKADFIRYYIDLKLKNSDTIVLLSLISQNDAEKILNFLSPIIKRKSVL